MEHQPIESEHFRRLAEPMVFDTDEQLEQYVEAVLHGELLHTEQIEPTHKST